MSTHSSVRLKKGIAMLGMEGEVRDKVTIRTWTRILTISITNLMSQPFRQGMTPPPLLSFSQMHAIYHNPSGEVDVRFPPQTTATTSGVSGVRWNRGNTTEISFTASTSRVTPVAQAALNIAIQHRLEKMVAEVGSCGNTG